MQDNPSIQRRTSLPVQIGSVTVGGEAPIAVQSMTDTDTEDAKATAEQILQLAHAGSELVRITVNTEKAAAQVARICETVRAAGCQVPIVGDFHYNGHKLLTQYPDCAQALDKYRINPGNVGYGNKRDAHFTTLIETALKYNKPIRIGVNWGSLDQDLMTRLMDANAKRRQPRSATAVTEKALVLSALLSAQLAERIGLDPNKIILSCKVSQVQRLVKVYQALARRCTYALHLGLTEAGIGAKGIVATTTGLAILLQQGIGDTLRASLTPEPGGNRCQEVSVCQQILQALELRAFAPAVTACPGCGRTSSRYFQTLTYDIQHYLQARMPAWRQQYTGVETLSVAVMGCIVNGPGESKHANIGISLPGKGEDPVAPVFADGRKIATLRGHTLLEQFQQLIEDYVTIHYALRPMNLPMNPPPIN